MPDYKLLNRGKKVGVFTLSSDVNTAETVSTNGTSAATVQAVFFPEARRVWTSHTGATLPKTFGPGKVLLSELGIAPGADFQFDSWEPNNVAGTHINK